jgi:hypothetical protein
LEGRLGAHLRYEGAIEQTLPKPGYKQCGDDPAGGRVPADPIVTRVTHVASQKATQPGVIPIRIQKLLGQLNKIHRRARAHPLAQTAIVTELRLDS